MGKNRLFRGVLLLFCVAGAWAQTPERLQPIRVGIFQVEPLNYIDENGKAQGINPDLLREIALQRGRWRPEFVPVTWAEGLDKLEKEELDLMVSVTYTPERTKFLDFSKVAVLEMRSQVYVRLGSKVNRAQDLQGFRVGIMKQGIHGQNFIDLAEAYGIDYEVSEYDSHRDIFMALVAGEIEAGVGPSHVGLQQSREFDLKGTKIQFAPQSIHFAAKKGRNGDVLDDINVVLAEWKADKSSYYYWRLDHWFGADHPWMRTVPLWLKIAAAGGVVAAFLFLMLSWLFRRQVQLRTRELSASEKRYRLIVENQSDLVVKIDVEGRFLYVNPTYCAVFGKTEGELLGNAFLPLVHEEDRASTEVELAKIFEPPHVAYIEQRAMTQKGWRWFSWQDSAILDESGAVKEIIGIGRDITERKEAEEAYRKTMERLQLATRAGQVGIWEYDFVQDNLIWDEQMFALFGVDQRSFDGNYHSWANSLHPDDRLAAEEQFKRAVEEQIDFKTEFRVVCNDKQIKHIRTLAEIERNEAGQAVKIVGMNWDVSSLHQMVEALTASERDYRLLFENMTTGFLQLEVLKNVKGQPIDFRVVQMNDAGCSITGKNRSQLVGKNLTELFQPLEDYWVDVLSKVAITGKASAYENRVEALGLVLSTWTFVPKPGFLAVVFSDNTARRTAEESVQQAQQQLEHIVENAKDFLWQIDIKGQFIYANAAVERMTGYTVDQILNMTVLDLMTPDYHAMAGERIAQRRAGNPQEDDYAFTIRCADGSIKWLELSTSSIVNAAGELEGTQGTARDITARKLAERELEESRRFLITILDMIPVGVFWKDRDFKYQGANRTFLDSMGFEDSADIIGKDDKFVLHDKSIAESCRDIDRKVLDTGEPCLNYEHNQRTTTGKISTLLKSKVPLTTVGGELIGVLGAYVDVTERKAAEEELAESRYFLRSIIDTIPARVFWKNKDSAYLGCNLAFAKDAGVENPQDLVGMSDADLSWSAEEAEQYRLDDLAVMSDGLDRINFEEPQTHRDGTTYWLSTSKVPIRDRAGDIIGVLGAYQDISVRKSLEEERIRLSAAINQSAEAIVIMDLHGIILYVNLAFETITGFSHSEAIGANLNIIKSERHGEQFYANIWDTIRAGNSWNGRIINRHKDGTYFTVESALSPVKDLQNTVVNYVVAIRDVSQQVELEEHIRQAQKMDAVGRLAGGVAHDFNNILQSILGFSGILMSEMDESSSQYDDVSEIRKAARRAGDLTRQLLTLSRKHNVNYAVQDLNAIIRSNKKMMRRLIGERIKFVFDFDDELKSVRADLSQIEQIILNLFINARDAMPQGGQVLVKTSNITAIEQEEGSGDGLNQICLEVSDTGCGIRDDVRAHLFEPFFTTKQVGEGTGLGLSVVYGIVQQHGGHIEVSSKVGEGAAFKVYLPACDTRELSLPDDDPDLDAEHSLGGQGELVLVVEDDTVLRNLAKRMLRDAGYAVTAVSNVQEATDAIKGTPFKLLLVDMVLPDGSGLDLVRSARSAGSEFAVLLCSGYPHELDDHESMNINGFRYIEKPIGSMQLLQSVREMLDEKRAV